MRARVLDGSRVLWRGVARHVGRFDAGKERGVGVRCIGFPSLEGRMGRPWESVRCLRVWFLRFARRGHEQGLSSVVAGSKAF